MYIVTPTPTTTILDCYGLYIPPYSEAATAASAAAAVALCTVDDDDDDNDDVVLVLFCSCN